MKESLPIKIKSTWPDACFKYGWGDSDGLCVDYSFITIAKMADKNLEFIIKRSKKKYIISPNDAVKVVKKWGSVYTRKKDRKPVAVIPMSECEVL